MNIPRRLAFALFALAACGGEDPAIPAIAAPPRPGDAELAARAEPPAADTEGASPATTCRAPIAVYEAGARVEDVCVEDLDARGLTILDLTGDFAPRIFKEAPELGEIGHQPYRDAYLALADERLDALPPEIEPETGLELFGIFPTFRVLRARLDDDDSHRCHDAVDDEALVAIDWTLHAWSSTAAEQRARIRRARFAEISFERERTARGLPSIAALEGVTTHPSTFATWQRESRVTAAIRAAQAHLACDDLESYEAGVFDGRTASALGRYQRRHDIVAAGALDPATRAQMREDSRELDFRAVLRALRERVVDASGLIEDGSARSEWGTVLGRTLDPPEMRSSGGHEPRADGAADLVSAATGAAATALGWTDAEAVRAFLASSTAPDRVAVRLPARPSYHATHMELRVEIDRGDVWYDYPYTSTGGARALQVRRRPMTTVFARDGDHEIALVRWPTTIGGWKPERSGSGGIGLSYKGSPAGPRVWRHVIASPAWMPPPSTPDDELLRRAPGGGWRPQTALFGPGHRSAYGLVMMVHERVIPPRGDATEPTFFDEGVRSHGSVSYASILHGTSHGCHRLYNHLAVRIAGFLLAHRTHTRDGSILVRFGRRVVAPDGSVQTIRIPSRGYQYELVPPVPVEVLEGTIMGARDEPLAGFRPLRGDLVRRAEEAAAGDEM